jgi:2-polyprenyl-3-methyl-5-hydroxy-6-metoxy-1,4-benzoquinol methylase
VLADETRADGAPVSEHEHWQLDGSAPELYERHLVPAITSIWASDLIDRVEPKAGQSVLDIACGTGVVARSAAERMATGRVVGLDLNRGMLAVAMNGAKAAPLAFPLMITHLILCFASWGFSFFPTGYSPSAK